MFYRHRAEEMTAEWNGASDLHHHHHASALQHHAAHAGPHPGTNPPNPQGSARSTMANPIMLHAMR